MADQLPILTTHRQFIVEFLQNKGNEIESSKGHCSEMISQGTAIEIRSVTNILRDMERQGMIERRCQSKRTFMVRLLDPWRTDSKDRVLDLVREETVTMTMTDEQDGYEQSYDYAKASVAIVDEILARVEERATWVPPEQVQATVEKATTEWRKANDEIKKSAAQIQGRFSQATNEAANLRALLVKRDEQIDLLQNEIVDLQRKIKEGIAGPSLREHLRERSQQALDNMMRQIPKNPERP